MNDNTVHDEVTNDGVREATEGVREALDQIGAGSRRLCHEIAKSARKRSSDSLEYCVGGLSNKITSTIRREPLIVITGAFAIGFITGKLLRRLTS